MNPDKKRYLLVVRRIVRWALCAGLAYFVFVSTHQSDRAKKGRTGPRASAQVLTVPWEKDARGDEQRIARQFERDTLPGLMRFGLIKKYERHRTCTTVYVAGKIWKERSRFFKESLLLGALVFNKVNGYPLEIKIVDHSSHRLYAQAASEDRKEIFD